MSTRASSRLWKREMNSFPIRRGAGFHRDREARLKEPPRMGAMRGVNNASFARTRSRLSHSINSSANFSPRIPSISSTSKAATFQRRTTSRGIFTGSRRYDSPFAAKPTYPACCDGVVYPSTLERGSVNNCVETRAYTVFTLRRSSRSVRRDRPRSVRWIEIEFRSLIENHARIRTRHGQGSAGERRRSRQSLAVPEPVPVRGDVRVHRGAERRCGFRWYARRRSLLCE